MSSAELALGNIERPESKEKFIAVYKAANQVTTEEAQQFFEVEAFNFKRMIQENPAFDKCSQLSIAGVFLDVIANGLTFEKAAKQVYLIPRSVKIGQGYQTRLTYQEAADGLIHLCKRANSIRHCSSPVIVFECDEIKVKTSNGKINITHSPAIPKTSKVIVGGFCFVTLTNGEVMPFWMGVEEIDRLKVFSAKSNSYYDKNQGRRVLGKPNALYSSGDGGQIDTGFFQTKIVKAALRRYSKKRVPNESHFDEDTDISIQQDNDFDYIEATTAPQDEAPVEVAETVADVSEEIKSEKKPLAF